MVASPAKGGPPIADLLQARVTGLVQVFAWPTFGLMLIGMALGFVVGLLPGLGGPTTLALMLPFVFKKTPGEAFAFLLALSLGGFAFVYGLFERGLGAPFPTGRILVWLGYAT